MQMVERYMHLATAFTASFANNIAEEAEPQTPPSGTSKTSP
jgi:hypothetical protein